MDEMDYENTDETGKKKKFQLTRGKLIMLVGLLIVIIAVIITIVIIVNKNKPKYTTEDFKRLESRMVEETPNYLTQKNIELTGEEIKIDLSELLTTNGGTINPSITTAAKVCKGYVLAVSETTEKYDAYIKCGDMYMTTGYVSNEGSSTTTKSTTKKDTTKPVITLIGDAKVTTKQNETYTDAGAKATDNVDGDITSSIKTTSTVNTSKLGTYVVTYTVSDKAGNKSTKTRTVTVIANTTTKATTIVASKTTTTKASNSVKTTTKVVITTTAGTTVPPTLTLKGSTTVSINQGSSYSDAGYSATDAFGVDITSRVNVNGTVNTNVAGTYTLTFSVTDSYGNSAYASRIVKVVSTYVKLKSIAFTPNALTMSAGGSYALTISYNPTDATNKTLSWSSDTPSVATVNNGTITAVSAGSAIITANGADGVSKQIKVIVK